MPAETDADGADADADAGTDDNAETATPTSADEILTDLFAVIEDRKANLPEGSYTTSLFTHKKGENAVLEKLGEEVTEVILAAKDDETDEIAYEAADLVYHLLVLLSMKDMDLEDLRAELDSRR